MREINYTYKRTKEDFKIHSIWNRFFRSPFSYLLNFILPVVALFTLLFYGSTLVSEMVFLTLYILLFPVFNYLLTLYAIKRVVSKDNMEFDTTSFTFNEDGIHISSSRGDLTLEYTRIVYAYNVKKYIYIYLDRTNAFLINKEFVGVEDSNQIMDYLIKYCVPGTVKNRTR